MKYNFSECNNLQWKIGEDTGFLKKVGKTIVLFYDEIMVEHDTGVIKNRIYGTFNISNEDECLEPFKDFEIVPRNPNEYNDFKLNDAIRDIETNDIGIVEGRVDNLIGIHWAGKNPEIEWITCRVAFFAGYRLINTDYEIDLIGNSFTKGDKVLVRNTGNKIWAFGFFEATKGKLFIAKKEDSNTAAYFTYNECIPYNKHTYHLLGTANDYNYENR